MKLHELLERTPFDAIAPHIVRICPEQTSQLPHYKEVYDILLHTSPAQTEEQICIRWCRVDEEYGEDPYISVGNCEGDFWATNLGKEVVLAEDVKLSNGKLAAYLMWSITFYGFTPNECSYGGYESDYRSINCYEEKVINLQMREFRNYARRKPDDARCIATIEEWREIEKRQAYRNRPKRMRDHRQQQLIKKYERMSKVQKLIDAICSASPETDKNKLQYLFNTNLISEVWHHSRAYNVERRMDYLVELLTKYVESYQDADSEQYDRMLLLFITSPDYPLLMAEYTQFAENFAHFQAGGEADLYFGTDPSLDQEVKLLIVKSR